jgi:hypothetical protein
MKKIVLGILLCVPSVSPHASNSQTLKEQYEALLKEYEASVEAWQKKVDDAKENNEPRWPALAFVPRFLKLAEGNLREPGATDALFWVVDKATNIQVGGRDFYPYYRQALELQSGLHQGWDGASAEHRAASESGSTRRLSRDADVSAAA